MINSTKKITGNRIIMDYAIEFVTNYSEKMRKQELRDINCIRLVKGLLLLFKLVGINGREITNTCTNNKELSVIE